MGFPSPYTSPDEEEIDRRRCAELRPERTQVGQSGPDGEDEEANDDPSAIFEELADGTFAFRGWTIAFRDELANRLESIEEGERRARYQLAQLWLSEVDDNAGSFELLKVAGALFRLLPFEDGSAAGTDDAEDDESGDALAPAGEPE